MLYNGIQVIYVKYCPNIYLTSTDCIHLPNIEAPTIELLCGQMSRFCTCVCVDLDVARIVLTNMPATKKYVSVINIILVYLLLKGIEIILIFF